MPLRTAVKLHVGFLRIFVHQAIMTNLAPLTNAVDPASIQTHDRKSSWPVLLLFAIVGYFFSKWLLSVYTESDQEFYYKFYYAIMFSDMSYWADLQRINLGSAEPLYRYVIGFGAYFQVDRIVYLSVWNALLIGAVCYALLLNRVSLLFWFFAITSNYLLVLIGPAERLKFAYLCLIIAFTLRDGKAKNALAMASIFFHTQAIAQLAAAAVGYVLDNYKNIFRNRLRTTVIILLGVPAVIIVGYVFFRFVGDVASDKASKYSSESSGVLETVQWLIVLVCGFLSFDRRMKFALSMVPIGILTAMYGGRFNVATFALFCATAMSEKKTAHPVVLLLMAYMSFKSIGFIQNTLAYGQAF